MYKSLYEIHDCKNFVLEAVLFMLVGYENDYIDSRKLKKYQTIKKSGGVSDCL